MTGNVGRFVNRNDGPTHRNPFAGANQMSNPAPVDRQRQIYDLHVKVPETRLDGKEEYSVSIEQLYFIFFLLVMLFTHSRNPNL